MSPVSGPEKLVVAARAGGITDRRVLEGIRRTPRAAFVPGAYVSRAYDDAPVPIPHGQVTTQPSLSAAMIAALGLTGAEEVFEVGTGYGYQAALLARLAARVVSIDIWPDLAARARRNLDAQGIGNVVVLAGDGTREPRISRRSTRSWFPLPALVCPRRCRLSSGQGAAWCSPSAQEAQNMSFCMKRGGMACGGCGP
jgi:SAM-dependent methyltransferase